MITATDDKKEKKAGSITRSEYKSLVLKKGEVPHVAKALGLSKVTLYNRFKEGGTKITNEMVIAIKHLDKRTVKKA